MGLLDNTKENVIQGKPKKKFEIISSTNKKTKGVSVNIKK